MEQVGIDLKKEQLATLARPRYPYSQVARLFFHSMDLVVGRRTTLPKAKLIEMLAGIPYRAWERRQYVIMTREFRNRGRVAEARAVIAWARAARANEHWHLLVIEEKMREEGAAEAWYLKAPIPQTMMFGYKLLCWGLARSNLCRGYLFNAEFEDHAEHTYAELVRDHPEWEGLAVTSRLVKSHGNAATWADAFRRIGLDERDHMNNSFRYAGREKWVVRYEGMPDEAAVPKPAAASV